MFNSIREIRIADAKEFAERTSFSHTHDALSWHTLNSWDRDGRGRFFSIDDRLLLGMSRDIADPDHSYWAILNAPEELPDILARLSHLHDVATTPGIIWSDVRFSLVSEEVATMLRAHDAAYHVVADPDSAEYIYKATDLLHPAGKRMRRYNYNLLLSDRLLADADIKIDEVTDADELQALIDVAQRWHRDGPGPHNDTVGAEYQALRQLCTDYLSPDIVIYRVIIDGNIASCCVARFVQATRTVVIPHLKCDYTYRAIFDKTLHLVLTHMANTHEFDEVNLSSDMGIPGLRQHKTGLRPIRMQSIYQIIPAELVDEID